MSDYQPTPPSSTPYASGGYGAPVQRYNVLAIVGFILAFVFNIAGLIVSIIGFNQIKRTGEQGRGLALAGIIISAVSIVLGLIFVIFYIVVIAAAISSGSVPTSGS